MGPHPRSDARDCDARPQPAALIGPARCRWPARTKRGGLSGAADSGVRLKVTKRIERCAAIVINPAGLSFFSVPVLDSLKTVSEPIFEVHVTNIHRRDPLYQKSIISGAVTGVICGLGPFGYQAAILAIADHYATAAET